MKQEKVAFFSTPSFDLSPVAGSGGWRCSYVISPKLRSTQKQKDSQSHVRIDSYKYATRPLRFLC